jgi:Mce-associated membrane protein
MASDVSVEVGTAPEPIAPRPGRRRVVLALCAVATIGLGGFGTWAVVTAAHLRATAATANTAIVNRAATGAVQRDVTRTVNTIFSYSYTDTARTRSAAQSLLTGAAVKQYDQLFALVEQQAPKEKLVVTTRVSSVGVELLTGNRARALVFASQQDTRAGTKQVSYAGAMFAVTAVDRNGRWLIEDIDTFTGS